MGRSWTRHDQANKIQKSILERVLYKLHLNFKLMLKLIYVRKNIILKLQKKSGKLIGMTKIFLKVK